MFHDCTRVARKCWYNEVVSDRKWCLRNGTREVRQMLWTWNGYWNGSWPDTLRVKRMAWGQRSHGIICNLHRKSVNNLKKTVRHRWGWIIWNQWHGNAVKTLLFVHITYNVFYWIFLTGFMMKRDFCFPSYLNYLITILSYC